jgi:hypothetical protein
MAAALMPKKVEEKLRREARKKGLKGKRAKAYVYGTMEEDGLMPRRKKKK